MKTLSQDLSDAALTLSKIQKMSDFLMQSKTFLRRQKKFGTKPPPHAKIKHTGMPEQERLAGPWSGLDFSNP